MRQLLAIVCLVVCLLALPASAVAGNGRKWQKTALVPPSAGAPAEKPASGRVKMRPGRSATIFRLRLKRLEPKTDYTVRLADDLEAVIRLATNRRGRVKARWTTAPGPEGAGRYTGRAVDVVHDGTGLVALAGVLPGALSNDPDLGDDGDGDAGGGDGGGDDEPAETRLPGVAEPGPYATAEAVFSLPTAAGGLAPRSTTVYYPGAGDTVSGLAATYPPIVVVHGFQLRGADYSTYGRRLASWGFVVLVGDHGDPLFFPDHEKQIATTIGYIDWLVAENAAPGSRFEGRLEVNRFGVMGHSLGGGATLVAANRPGSAGRVEAYVGLAPAPLQSASRAEILPDPTSGNWPATLVITGSEDAVISPQASKGLAYDPAPAPRTFLRFDGHCHMNFADSVGFPASLGSDYDPATCVLPAEQTEKVRTYVVPWFLYHLKDDGRVLDYVDGTYASEDASVEEFASSQ